MNHSQYLKDKYGSDKFVDVLALCITEQEQRRVLTMLDEMEEAKAQHALIDIALVKSYAYTEEYNPVSGRTEPKRGHTYLKEGFVDGFLAGVAFRMGGGE